MLSPAQQRAWPGFRVSFGLAGVGARGHFPIDDAFNFLLEMVPSPKNSALWALFSVLSALFALNSVYFFTEFSGTDNSSTENRAPIALNSVPHD